jgi:hypothetical protein
MLSDPDTEVRLGAGRNIWEFSSNERLTLPVLLRQLPSADTFDKSRIVGQLNEMGPRAGAAVPALLSELTNSDGPLLVAITNALKQIDLAAAAALIGPGLENRRGGDLWPGLKVSTASCHKKAREGTKRELCQPRGGCLKRRIPVFRAFFFSKPISFKTYRRRRQ